MRLISLGRARLVSSEGRQRPALLETSDLAAENKMLGSFSLIEVPKPAYIPFYFAWIFMHLKRIAISLFSSRVYGKTEQLVIRGRSR